MQEVKAFTETDAIKQAVSSADTATLAARVLTTSLLESPYATVESSLPALPLQESELRLKSREILRFYGKVWAALVKFLRSQGRKNKSVNSVYFGRLIYEDNAYKYIPSSKFLEENSLHYTEHDQFNLSPFAEQVVHSITIQAQEKMPAVSTASIATVCSTRKDVIRFVMKEIMDSISKLLLQHGNAKLTLNLGIGQLVISHHTLHFENKKKEEAESQQGGKVLSESIIENNPDAHRRTQSETVQGTLRDVFVRQSEPQYNTAKLKEYREIMHERVSDSISRLSVKTPQTRFTNESRLEFLARRNKELYGQIQNRGKLISRPTKRLVPQKARRNPITQEFDNYNERPQSFINVSTLQQSSILTHERLLPSIEKLEKQSDGGRSVEPMRHSLESGFFSSKYPKFLEMDRPGQDRMFHERKQESTQDQAYQRIKKEIEGKRKKIVLQKREEKEHRQNQTNYLNNVRAMRVQALHEHSIYLKNQDEVMKERKEQEEKERKAMIKTNLGPEETVETIKEEIERGKKQKAKFKNDMLRQIYEKRTKQVEEKKAKLKDEMVLTNVALRSLQQDVDYMKEKKHKESKLLADTWKKQQEWNAWKEEVDSLKH